MYKDTYYQIVSSSILTTKNDFGCYIPFHQFETWMALWLRQDEGCKKIYQLMSIYRIK